MNRICQIVFGVQMACGFSSMILAVFLDEAFWAFSGAIIGLSGLVLLLKVRAAHSQPSDDRNA